MHIGACVGELSFDDEAKRYLEEFRLDLDEVEALILQLSEAETKQDSIAKLFRIIHSLKGTAGSYGFSLLSVCCHRMEDAFLSEEISGTESLIDDLLDLKDTLLRICEAYSIQDKITISRISETLGVGDNNSHEGSVANQSQNLNSNLNPNQYKQVTAKPKKRILIGENSKLLMNIITRSALEFDVEIAYAKDGYAILGRLLKEKFEVLIAPPYIATIDLINLFEILKIVPNPNSSIKAIAITSSVEKLATLNRKDTKIVAKDSNLNNNLTEVLTSWLPKKDVGHFDFFKKPTTVLVIDDSQDIHNLVRLATKKYSNIKLLHCLNAKAAEALIVKEKPDIILLDVQMPEISGDQLFSQLKKKSLVDGSSVIFLTATDKLSELNALGSLGVKGILKKPFSTKTLVQQISRFYNDEGV